MEAVVEEFFKRLIAERRGLFLFSGGTIRIGIGDAKEAVEWFASRSIPITGMEGFDTDGKYLIPRLEYLADFSDISGALTERVRESAKSSLHILEDWTIDGPMFVEFGLDLDEQP